MSAASQEPSQQRAASAGQAAANRNRYAHLVTGSGPCSWTDRKQEQEQERQWQQQEQEAGAGAHIQAPVAGRGEQCWQPRGSRPRPEPREAPPLGPEGAQSGPNEVPAARWSRGAQKKAPPLGAASRAGRDYYASLSSFDWRQQWALLKGRLLERAEEPASQRKLILVIVCCALLLDNMLYMVVVPIIPDYLRSIGAWSTYAENANWVRQNSTTTGGGAGAGAQASQQVKWVRVSGQLIYEGEDSAVGFLFASKAIVQLFINPFSGAIIDRVGYELPMMIGLTVMFFSTMVFACGQTYGILFLARSLQGVGSAFADTSGLAMIADRFTEENERQRALGVALAFISFGCLVAPPFGSVLYDAAGKEVPFIILSLVCLLDGSLLLLVVPDGTFRQILARLLGNWVAGAGGEPQPAPAVGADRKQPPKLQRSISRRQSISAANDGKQPTGTPIYVLLKDPCIACCAGSLVVANVSLAFLEPTISIWVQNTMEDIEEWQLGMIWLPAFVPHVLGVYCTVKLADKYPRYQWLIAAIGLTLEGLSCLMVPFCSSFWSLMVPISIICFGLALIDTAILPTLGYLVDTRYISVYGSIYAIADISYSLSYAVGPILAGGIVEAIGFRALNFLIAILICGYAPLLMMLRTIRDYEPFEACKAPAGWQADAAAPLGPQPAIAEETEEEESQAGSAGGGGGSVVRDRPSRNPFVEEPLPAPDGVGVRAG